MSEDTLKDNLKKERDSARCDLAVQAVLDVLWRFDEAAEGDLTAYDVMSYVVEDLVKAGWCAACVSDSISEAFQRVGADPTQHRPEEGASDDEVFH